MSKQQRECGSCTLCCSVLGIEEIAKPRGQWCRHCQVESLVSDVAVGCAIYQQRPLECRGFRMSVVERQTGRQLVSPITARIVVYTEPSKPRNRLIFDVDPDFPDRWREAPYHATIRAAALRGVGENFAIIVMVGGRQWRILPNQDVEITPFRDSGRRLCRGEDHGPETWEVRRMTGSRDQTTTGEQLVRTLASRAFTPYGVAAVAAWRS